MALNQVAFVFALTFANVTIATLVTLCTIPVCAALLSRALLGEALQSRTVVALVSAIVGVALLVGFDRLAEKGASTWIGVGLALLSATSFGLIQVCVRVLANRYYPMQTLSVFFFVVVLALLPITLVQGFVTTYPFVGWVLLAHLGRHIGPGVHAAGARTAHDTGHDGRDRLPARAAHEHLLGMAAPRRTPGSPEPTRRGAPAKCDGDGLSGDRNRDDRRRGRLTARPRWPPRMGATDLSDRAGRPPGRSPCAAKTSATGDVPIGIADVKGLLRPAPPFSSHAGRPREAGLESKSKRTAMSGRPQSPQRAAAHPLAVSIHARRNVVP